VTPEITPDELRRMFREHENTMNRLVKSAMQPLKDQSDRIERQVVATNGRVTHLEAWRIEANARADERANAAKLAAELVAKKAAEVISDRERSHKWWLGLATAVTGGIVAVTTLTGVLAQYLAH